MLPETLFADAPRSALDALTVTLKHLPNVFVELKVILMKDQYGEFILRLI